MSDIPTTPEEYDDFSAEMHEENTMECDWCERHLPKSKVDKLHDQYGEWVLNRCKDVMECESYMETQRPTPIDTDEIPF